MNKIYTIGHSIIGMRTFIQKLHEFHIDVLIDVRTKPYSSRVNWFNREALLTAMNNNDIEYVYKGKNLGGLGKNIKFSETIDELIELSENKKIVLMCSEGNYAKCHRYLTLTPEIESKGKIVEHISWNDNKGIVQAKLF